MRIYQLLTGNRDYVEFRDRNPLDGQGWGLRVEQDEKRPITDEYARLISPEGEVLGRLRITMQLPHQIGELIRKDIDKQQAPSRPAWMDRLTRYHGTTGDEAAAKALRHHQADGWYLEVAYLKPKDGKVADHIQLLEGGRPFADVWIEPRSTLRERVVAVVNEHHAGGARADSQQPVPLVTVRPTSDGRPMVCLWLSGEEGEDPGQANGRIILESDEGELDEIVAGYLRQYPHAKVLLASDEVAAASDPVGQRDEPPSKVAAPVPLRTAPADAAAAARAARQVGQALAETGRPPAGEPEVIREIPIKEIGHFPGGNIRERFDDLDELAESIRVLGILQPLTVNERDGRFTLIAGERRLRAAGLAGKTNVPCRVLHLSDEDALAAMLVENLQRRDINPIEEARAYQRLFTAVGSTVKVAGRVGRSQAHVAEYLKLLELPDDLQHQVATGDMGVKAGLTFLRQTRNVPAPVVEKVVTALKEEQPSIREAPKVIERVLKQEGIARAIPQPPAGQEPRKTGTQLDKTGQTQGTTGAQPDNGGQAAAVQPEVPRVDPHVERARALAEIGRTHWQKWTHIDPQGSADAPLLARDCYLPLQRVLKHWGLRQDLGATALPKTMGAPRVDIPEQKIWIKGPDDSSYGGGCDVELDGTKLTIKIGHHGGLEAMYTGNPVYYRCELIKGSASGGHKYLRQQLVIQDGGRHIVLTGSGTAMIRADLVPLLADLVNELPGLPGGEGEKT